MYLYYFQHMNKKSQDLVDNHMFSLTAESQSVCGRRGGGGRRS